MNEQISNQQAANELKAMQEHVEPYMSIVGLTAYNMAIKALEQRPCEDCISRESLKQKLQKRRDFFINDYSGFKNLPSKEKARVDEIDNCIAMVVNESSITPQQTRWIPVTERLPEVCEFVDCTCHSLIDDREDWVIETVYIPQLSDSPYSDWGNIPMLNSGDCKVVAWMHRDIPEPYKAESEGSDTE